MVQEPAVCSSTKVWQAPESHTFTVVHPSCADLAPENCTLNSSSTFELGFPSTDDILQNDTIDSVNRVQCKYWKYFRWSRRAVMYGWLGSNLFRFCIFYYPWLSMKGQAVSALANRTVRYAAGFMSHAVALECDMHVGRLVNRSGAFCAHFPDMALETCAGLVSRLGNVTCPDLMAEEAVQASAVVLVATAMEAAPYLAILVKALALLVMPSLGLVLGVVKGSLN
eukprot:gene36306-34362_t